MVVKMCRSTCSCNRPKTKELLSHLVILPFTAITAKMKRQRKFVKVVDKDLSHSKHSDAIAVPRPGDPIRGDAHGHNIYDAGDCEVIDKCEGMIIGTVDAKVYVHKLINRGSFGRVYVGEFVTSGAKVAIKAEDQGSGHEKIMTEGNLLRKLEGGPGIPLLYWYSMHGSQYNFLVMEFLGPSLLDLFQLCDNIFSLQTVLKMLKQLLATLEFVHDQNIMHRDISPRNIVIGVGQNVSKLYLIDFGLAKKCTRRGQMMLPSPVRYGPNCNPLIGTPRFASINNHRGGILGRSDDLEALGYLMVFLVKGHLPWVEETTLNIQDGIRDIGHMKIATSVEKICEGIPDEFATLISYARLLKYYEMPDYKSINVLFDKLIERSKVNITEKFDWEIQSERAARIGSKMTLSRSKRSLPRIRCGSDENTPLQFECPKCSNDVHFSLNST